MRKLQESFIEKGGNWPIHKNDFKNRALYEMALFDSLQEKVTDLIQKDVMQNIPLKEKIGVRIGIGKVEETEKSVVYITIFGCIKTPTGVIFKDDLHEFMREIHYDFMDDDATMISLKLSINRLNLAEIKED